MRGFRLILLGVLGVLPAFSVLAQQQPVKRPAEEQVLAEKQFIEATREKNLEHYEEAIALFNEILSKDKNNHAACFELARVYHLAKQSDKALEKAQNAVTLSPGNLYYADFYAVLLERAGRYKDAATFFEGVVKKFPENDSLQFRLGYYYQKAGKPEQAIKVYNVLENRMGVSREVSLNKYYAWVSLNKVSKAAAELEALIKAFPRELEHYELLARYYDQQNMKEESYQVCERMIAQFPDNPRANLRMAEIYKSRGEEIKYLTALTRLFDDPALSVDDKVRSIMPYLSQPAKLENAEIKALLLQLGRKTAEAHPSEAKAFALNGDLCFQCGDAACAFDAYRATLRLAKNKREVWQNYLLSGVQLARYEEVLAGSQEAMDLFPNDPMGYYFHGMALLRRNKYDDALSDLEQALMMSGKLPALKADILGMIGSVHARRNDFTKADDSFQRGLALNPDSFVALNEYSYSLLLRGQQLDKAAEMSRRANTLMPNNLVFQSNYARILYKQKDFAESRKWFEKALALGGENQSDLLEAYGDVLYRLNQIDEAVKYWQKALEKGASSDNLNRKLSTRTLQGD